MYPPPFEKSPIKAHRFHVLPPLKNHCFWWVLISGWAFISTNTVFQKVSSEELALISLISRRKRSKNKSG